MQDNDLMAWHRCEECGKKFAFQKSLLEHQSSAHGSRGSGRVGERCTLCPYESYGYNGDLELHMRLQHADSVRPVKCSKCRKLLDSPSSLLRHMEILHPSQASYALQLKPHKASSFGIRSKGHLKCRLCGKKFPTPFSLEQHALKKHRSVSTESTATSPESCGGPASSVAKIPFQNYGPALTSKATEFPVIYRVKDFKLGRSLVIIRVTSH